MQKLYFVTLDGVPSWRTLWSNNIFQTYLYVSLHFQQTCFRMHQWCSFLCPNSLKLKPRSFSLKQNSLIQIKMLPFFFKESPSWNVSYYSKFRSSALNETTLCCSKTQKAKMFDFKGSASAVNVKSCRCFVVVCYGGVPFPNPFFLIFLFSKHLSDEGKILQMICNSILLQKPLKYAKAKKSVGRIEKYLRGCKFANRRVLHNNFYHTHVISSPSYL